MVLTFSYSLNISPFSFLENDGISFLGKFSLTISGILSLRKFSFNLEVFLKLLPDTPLPPPPPATASGHVGSWYSDGSNWFNCELKSVNN